MGEADAARMLVAGVDVDKFTPKMVQVGRPDARWRTRSVCCARSRTESAIMTSAFALVSAICASLAGEPESAAAQIEDARRVGRIGGIDLTLAEKVVGAGANTGPRCDDRVGSGRSADGLAVRLADGNRHGAARSAGEFGLAPIAGVPGAGSVAVGAQRSLRPSSRPGSGFFLADRSSISIRRSTTRPIPATCRRPTRGNCARRSWAGTATPGSRRSSDCSARTMTPQKEAARALVARAATLVAPDPKLEKDAPELIAAMLAAGYDRAVARWIRRWRMDDETPIAAGRCWRSPRPKARRQFRPDHALHRPRQSPGKVRSALAGRGARRARPDQRRGQRAQPPLRARPRPPRRAGRR